MATDDRLSLLHQLLDALPVGVITLDRAGKVVHFNRAEERLARRTRQRALGRDFFREIAPCMDVRDLAGLFRDRIGRGPFETDVEFQFAYPYLDGPRDVVVHLRSLDVRGTPFAALVIEDVSEQRATQRMQDTLADLLAQDLESPIATILAHCGWLIQNAPQLDARALSITSEIAHGADQLQGMLTNLLDLSRLESGMMPIGLVRQAVAPLLHSAVLANRGFAGRRGVTIDLALDEPELEATCDATLVRRMLDNLLQNAIRHAAERGRVAVRAYASGDDQVVLEVVDDGVAIPPDRVDLVFEKFSRIDDGSGRADNRGLGLTYVELAARAHGGHAAAESEAGRNTFRVVLPGPEPATEFARLDPR